MSTGTATANAQAATIITPKFRMCFPSLFQPTVFKGQGGQTRPDEKPKYELTALFDRGADLSALQALAWRAVQKRWGSNVPSNLQHPFKDAASKAGKYDGFEAGMLYIKLSSEQPPAVVDQARQPVNEQNNNNRIYSGCYAHAAVNAWTYDQKGNRGVAFGLLCVQKLADGPVLGTSRRAEDYFEVLDVSQEAPLDLMGFMTTQGPQAGQPAPFGFPAPAPQQQPMMPQPGPAPMPQQMMQPPAQQGYPMPQPGFPAPQGYPPPSAPAPMPQPGQPFQPTGAPAPMPGGYGQPGFPMPQPVPTGQPFGFPPQQ